MNQTKTMWVEFSCKGYSCTAIFYENEWGGEFNFPIRRFVHSFFGKTQDEAEKEFQAGVEYYLSQIQSIPGLAPEKQGLEGALELLEMERRASEYEIQLLDWPSKISPEQKIEILELIRSTRRPISYNQAALDELTILMSKCKGSGFKQWADHVWRLGQLETTPQGLARTRKRQEAARNAVGEVSHD